MSKYGKIIEQGTIQFKRLLPGPIDRVWAYLTESEKRGKWLAAGEMELCEGGKAELNFKHVNLSPDDDPIPEKYEHMKDGSGFTGKITRFEPPHLLSYTWGGNSEVTFELKPQGEKVLLVLTHRRLDESEKVSVAAGWHTHLGILADRLNGRTPRGFWRVHSRMEVEYENRL